VVKSRVEEIEHDAAALRDYIQQQLDPRSAGELCAEVGDGMKG
jgi:hypothetical protein